MPGHRPRLVLDTNVVVSSLWGGNPAKVVELWKEGAVSLVLSLPVLKEYLAVLARFGLDDAQLKERGLLFLESPFSVLVHPRRLLHVVREDPADDRFLECAVEGRADALVSGDRHLLRLGRFRRIPILTPAEYLARRL